MASTSKLPWTPWHEVVRLRPDLKSGELSLNIFAADLYDVAMGVARPVRALKRNALFHQLLQALIELAQAGSEERSLLESISNHISARLASAEKRQGDMFRS